MGVTGDLSRRRGSRYLFVQKLLVKVLTLFFIYTAVFSVVTQRFSPQDFGIKTMIANFDSMQFM